MQISQTQVVVVVIMYRVVGSERQKERQKEESDKGAARERDRERKWKATPRHGVQAPGVSLAAVSTPRNANEPPHPAKRIKEQQQSLGH